MEGHRLAQSELPTYWPALDGLRGIAVLMVVAGHVGLAGRTDAGLAGVVVFFVLSGFLITSLLTRSATENRSSLPRFYIARAVRLVPALLIMVFVVSVVWVITGRPVVSLVEQGATAIFYVENILPARYAGGVYSHTWSLSVEEQFYLLWPVALTLAVRLNRRARAIALALAVALSLLIRFTLARTGFPEQAYASLPSNAFALLVGCLLAMIPLPNLRGYAWLALGSGMLGAGLLVAYSPLGRGLTSVIVTAAASVLVVVLVRGNAVFASKPLRYVGRISYAWYLWHWPMLWLTGTELQPWPGVIAVLASFCVAAVSTHLVEEPLRHRWRRRMRRQVKSASGGVGAAQTSRSNRE